MNFSFLKKIIFPLLFLSAFQTHAQTKSCISLFSKSRPSLKTIFPTFVPIHEIPNRAQRIDTSSLSKKFFTTPFRESPLVSELSRLELPGVLIYGLHETGVHNVTDFEKIPQIGYRLMGLNGNHYLLISISNKKHLEAPLNSKELTINVRVISPLNVHETNYIKMFPKNYFFNINFPEKQELFDRAKYYVGSHRHSKSSDSLLKTESEAERVLIEKSIKKIQDPKFDLLEDPLVPEVMYRSFTHSVVLNAPVQVDDINAIIQIIQNNFYSQE